MTNRRAALLAAVICAGSAAPSFAEDIAVNLFEDRPAVDAAVSSDADADTEGVQTTLRSAVQRANAAAGAHLITLPAGRYALTIRGAGEAAAATGDLDIVGEVTIQGAGAAATVIDAKRLKDRVFDVLAGADVTIAGVTVTRGKTPAEESGGGIRNHGSLLVRDSAVTKCKAADDAGGIDHQAGFLTLSGVLLLSNKAGDDGGGVDVDGGAVTLAACTLAKNKAKSEGGGLENSGATVSFITCTISGNKAKVDGGGVVNEDGGTMAFESCTVAFNKSKIGGGIDTADQEFGVNSTSAESSIFANNRKVNCNGVLSDTGEGGNLDSGSTCGFGAGNLSNTDPLLEKLAENGGRTPTHAIPAASPARDAGQVADCLPTDQRGLQRNGPCDSGAFEFQP